MDRIQGFWRRMRNQGLSVPGRRGVDERATTVLNQVNRVIDSTPIAAMAVVDKKMRRIQVVVPKIEDIRPMRSRLESDKALQTALNRHRFFIQLLDKPLENYRNNDGKRK